MELLGGYPKVPTASSENHVIRPEPVVRVASPTGKGHYLKIMTRSWRHKCFSPYIDTPIPVLGKV
jgi:hypothetical protein